MTDPITPITVTAKQLCAISGLCRDKIFQLLREGAIESFRCGKLRLISVESYRRWVAEQISLDKSRRVVPYRRAEGRP